MEEYNMTHSSGMYIGSQLIDKWRFYPVQLYVFNATNITNYLSFIFGIIL